MYSAAAGMAAQQQKLDATATDLANANTTGYKHVRVAFRDLLPSENQRATDAGTQIGTGAAATTIGRSQIQGALQNTGESLDVALSGPGFFTVKDSNGKTALTRDGNLRIDDQNRLTTHDGQLLEPSIKVPAGTADTDVKFGPAGEVTVGGKTIGTLRLVTVPAASRLQGGEGNTFLPTRQSGAPRAAGTSTRLQQGVLEASNVDMGTAMTGMIEAQRGYELASKAIQWQDQMADIANQIKR